MKNKPRSRGKMFCGRELHKNACDRPLSAFGRAIHIETFREEGGNL
jgi:hypothetical protein